MFGDLKTKLSNPGKFEDASREARSVILGEHDMIEGARFVFNKSVQTTRTREISVSHGVDMGSSRLPASYNFGAQLQTRKFMLSGRLDTNKTFITTARYHFGRGFGGQVFYQAVPGGHDFHTVEVDYRGSIYSAAVKHLKGVVSANYMQALTPTLSAGAEITHSYTGAKTVVGGALRYVSGDDIVTAEADSDGNATCTYTKKMGPKAAFTTTFTTHAPSRESTVKLGYEYNLISSRVRGVIESTGRVGCTLEERIAPQATVSLHADLDHKKKEYRFGMGLQYL